MGQEEQNEAAGDAQNPAAKSRQPDDGLSTDFLRDPKRMKEDIALAEKAITKRWGMSDHKRRQIVNRLLDIANKESVPAMSKFGPWDDEGKADATAVMAINALIKIEGQDQSDDHHKDDLEKPKGGVTVNVDQRRVVLMVPDNERGKIPEGELKAIEQK